MFSEMTHIGGMHIKLEMKQMKHYVRLFGETDRVFLYDWHQHATVCKKIQHMLLFAPL